MEYTYYTSDVLIWRFSVLNTKDAWHKSIELDESNWIKSNSSGSWGNEKSLLESVASFPDIQEYLNFKRVNQPYIYYTCCSGRIWRFNKLDKHDSFTKESKDAAECWFKCSHIGGWDSETNLIKFVKSCETGTYKDLRRINYLESNLNSCCFETEPDSGLSVLG